MLCIREMQNKLKSALSEERYFHSLGVKEAVIKLAVRYDVNIKKAVIAAILHDCAKDLPDDILLKKAIDFGILIGEIEREQPQLIHGPVGAMIAFHNFKVNDFEILKAIWVHTTGNSSMGNLDKILYIADYIEPNRKFSGVEKLRRVAFVDIDRALLCAFDNTLKWVSFNNQLIHPDTLTARSQLLKHRKTNRGRKSS